MDKQTALKKIAELSEEEKDFFREALGVKKEPDIDLVEGFLKLEKQMKDFEDFMKEIREGKGKKKGFFDTLFE